MMHLDEAERQVLLQGIQHRPGTTVARVDHHLEGVKDSGVDIAQKVADIVGKAVGGNPLTLELGWG